MRISIDLDDVIFNTIPLYKLAFNEVGRTFVKPTNWDLTQCYDDIIIKKLFEFFVSDILYTMPLIDKKIPTILNGLMQNPDLQIFFVTQRVAKNPNKTYQQLLNAGIKCSFDQVFDKMGDKSDILHDEVKTDLHFDDSPYVINGCIKKNVPIVMISNNTTKYNHSLRDKVEHYKNLRSALIQKGIYTRQPYTI